MLKPDLQNNVPKPIKATSCYEQSFETLTISTFHKKFQIGQKLTKYKYICTKNLNKNLPYPPPSVVLYLYFELKLSHSRNCLN